jgi:hypothetical protein
MECITVIDTQTQICRQALIRRHAACDPGRDGRLGYPQSEEQGTQKWSRQIGKVIVEQQFEQPKNATCLDIGNHGVFFPQHGSEDGAGSVLLILAQILTAHEEQAVTQIKLFQLLSVFNFAASQTCAW